jgi:hypothetical protein
LAPHKREAEHKFALGHGEKNSREHNSSRRVSACLTWRRHICTTLNDNVSPRTADYSLDLRLLGRWHRVLVKGLLEIVEKGFPLCRRYHEMLVRLLHGTAGVFLRPPAVQQSISVTRYLKPAGGTR